MTRRARVARRRTALLCAVSLVALGAPGLVVATSTPAVAAGPCLTEQDVAGPVLGLPTTACDDAVPPVTDQPTVSPAPTAFGYTRSATVTLTLHGHYTDADADVMGFECQFWNGDQTPTAPDAASDAAWAACGTGAAGSAPAADGSTTWTASLTKSGLTDSTGSAYHLRVRAVDGRRPVLPDVAGAGDSAAGRRPHDAFGNSLTDTPDLDAAFDETVQEVTFRVDTEAPNTFLTDTPVDDVRPDQPAVTSQNVPLTLDFFDKSKEIAGFACTLNGKRVPCREGSFRLTGLGPGKKTFAAVTVDKAGNVDPVPEKTTFWVPRNLSLGMGGRTTGRSCTRVANAAYFGGDYVQCTKTGDQLHFTSPTTKTREIRLIAPAGPRLGVVEVSVGEGRWIPVDLYSPTQQAVHSYLVRDQYEPPKAGQVRVRVKTLTAARPYVRIDAVLARS